MKKHILLAVSVIVSIHLLFFSTAGVAENKTILIVGDSISSAYGMDYEKGWVSLLKIRLKKMGYRYKVVNASITGDVTASGRQRIGKQLQLYSPDIVIIELGGNDGLRGLSIEDMQSNLQDMINQSTRAGSLVLLAGMKILPNYGPKYSKAFYQTYSELARQNTIALVPFILDGVGGVPAMIQADRIHPNEQAQISILDNVWPYLVELL